ncbi:T9SS type A sorting domain-containing protein [Apibacter sp. B3889]|uniref:T9SS type A sorting domain-containing protein n=1 Tax=unclassified Apibacter TaxID=2630820 RepID=UPI00132BBA0C|nr:MULTISPECIES: T9SS type A sorting domain-containing protein [unclassified Apibacter]MXO34010.1 T9SS type A sorting domain-containing protein [Apibacter sp. B3883]MXO41859.1 T9SS type A sorting domain-containing protein [Apibacter sp. B3889]MXP03429.1 T9SS type A sorting domain-containing protein [Apibacter sp. B3887]MXP07308.1 T9SS type A sorting domain-containing protein [Apibacter sp. B3935]
MKKNLLFILLWCFTATPLLATVNISKQENYLKEHFVASTTTNYDPMDVYGILNFFMQYSESEKKWNYELAGLTWEEMAQAINGNPEVIFTKLSGKFGWKNINGLKVLTQLNLNYKNYNGVFNGNYFKNLETLYCTGNQLTTIDITKNVNLKGLYCNSNQLTTLDISKNLDLTYLNCSSNQLTTLDISKNFNLKELYGYSNKLKALDVSKNVNLMLLNIYSNQLTTLDVSKNVNLLVLKCFSNQLTALDISKNVNLYSLNCNSNQLTTLDVSKNSKLIFLDCYSNKLKALDVSKNVNLTDLYCYSNQVTTLDVTKNVNLITLHCNLNQLTTLDVSKNVNLTTLNCYSNQLTTLDVSKNVNLLYLYFSDNKIAQLLVPKVHKISELSGINNNLKLSTLKGNFLTIKSLTLNPQATLQGGAKGIFELIDLSSEYAIDGKYTTYTWYDKTTQQEVGTYALKGKFYAGPENAGKTLICKMKNELIPSLVVEYEVTIKNTVSFASRNINENIPEGFVRVGPQKNETESIQLTPNPVIDILKISTAAKVTSASVYNYAGKEVKRYPKVINNELDLQDLPAGIYIVNIDTEKGRLSKKIIKK